MNLEFPGNRQAVVVVVVVVVDVEAARTKTTNKRLNSRSVLQKPIRCTVAIIFTSTVFYLGPRRFELSLQTFARSSHVVCTLSRSLNLATLAIAYSTQANCLGKT